MSFPRIQFGIDASDLEDFRQKVHQNLSKLKDTTVQANAVLNATRNDVDDQFDEKQASWKPLKKYTVRKKTRRKADMRILHETKKGEGLRLRDAYYKTGEVNSSGDIEYFYPPEKPYAKDLDKGKRTVEQGLNLYNKRGKNKLKNLNDELDRDYFRALERD